MIHALKTQETLAVSMKETNGDDPALADELEAAYTAAASLVPELAEDALRWGERLLVKAAETPTAAQRAALAHVAMQAALRGQDRASVTSLAELSWGDGVNKSHRYGELLRGIMADQLAWVRDRSHRRKIAEANGRDSLALAVEADQLARS